MVADARCVQVAVTRASRVRWRDGACALEDEGELRAHVLGCGEERLALTSLALPGTSRCRRRPQPAPGLGRVGGGRAAAWPRPIRAAWSWSTATCSPIGGCLRPYSANCSRWRPTAVSGWRA